MCEISNSILLILLILIYITNFYISRHAVFRSFVVVPCRAHARCCAHGALPHWVLILGRPLFVGCPTLPCCPICCYVYLPRCCLRFCITRFIADYLSFYIYLPFALFLLPVVFSHLAPNQLVLFIFIYLPHDVGLHFDSLLPTFYLLPNHFFLPHPFVTAFVLHHYLLYYLTTLLLLWLWYCIYYTILLWLLLVLYLHYYSIVVVVIVRLCCCCSIYFFYSINCWWCDILYIVIIIVYCCWKLLLLYIFYQKQWLNR